MSDHVDNWYKLVQVDTNIQAELQANLLRNNNIAVSIQALSAIPGLNSGAVLWVQQADLAAATAILEQINQAPLDVSTDLSAQETSIASDGASQGDGD